MRRLRKYGRLWHVAGDAACLEPWAEFPEQLRSRCIKQNAVRFVAKVHANDDADYFVKYENTFQIPFLHSKAQREFQAYELLKKHGIPCVEYVVWAAGMRENIVVSKALPERFLPLNRVWYDSPEPSELLLNRICRLICKMSLEGIYHPDLHMGNLMSDGQEIVLVDPPGVRECAPTDAPDPLMLTPLTEVFGDFSDEFIAGTLNSCGLYGTRGNAIRALCGIRNAREKTICSEWPRRCEQILSGTSKFAAETAPGCFLRNTAWFAPAPGIPLSVMEMETLPAEEGKMIWLDSFSDQLRKRKREKVPVRIEFSGKTCRIFTISGKKYTFFYGFR